MTTREAFRQISAIARAAESLSSWHDTTPHQTILAIVAKMTKESSAD
jgi:hypothetical protein